MNIWTATWPSVWFGNPVAPWPDRPELVGVIIDHMLTVQDPDHTLTVTPRNGKLVGSRIDRSLTGDPKEYTLEGARI